MNIEISQDKITGELFCFYYTTNSLEYYETELYRVWVYATKEQALAKWRELNEAKADKARQVYGDGILKIDKIFS